MKTGRCLALYDGYVVDLECFKNQHPGGAGIFNQIARGHEIGQFLNGSSTNLNLGSHRHSNYAHKILERLIIAKIEDTSLQLLWVDRTTFPKLLNNSAATSRLPPDEYLSFRVTNKTRIVDSSAILELTPSFPILIPKFYSSLTMVGRCLKITSL